MKKEIRNDEKKTTKKKEVNNEVKTKKNKVTKKKDSTKKNINTIHAFNILFVDIQIVITVLTVILAILFIFNQKYMTLFEFSLGLNLLVMAFNNYKIYKRSKLTLIYAFVGVMILFLIFLGV
ncbi:MAG: hypothetical protein E7160_03555 [Firmicutes bacterium]|nr:hypothetical protein [Bacillota bacterium]